MQLKVSINLNLVTKNKKNMVEIDDQNDTFSQSFYIKYIYN